MAFNGVICVIAPKSIVLEADYVTVVEDRDHVCRRSLSTFGLN